MTTATEAINAAILRLRTGNDCYYGDENARQVLASLVGEVLAIVQEKQSAVEARIYPCAECGTMRTKAEGGTTFTICDACWDRLYPDVTRPKHSLPTPRHLSPDTLRMCELVKRRGEEGLLESEKAELAQLEAKLPE